MNLKRIDANDPVEWIIENDSKSLDISGNLGILENLWMLLLGRLEHEKPDQKVQM